MAWGPLLRDNIFANKGTTPVTRTLVFSRKSSRGGQFYLLVIARLSSLENVELASNRSLYDFVGPQFTSFHFLQIAQVQ
jgi:hypothetical protein